MKNFVIPDTLAILIGCLLVVVLPLTLLDQLVRPLIEGMEPIRQICRKVCVESIDQPGTKCEGTGNNALVGAGIGLLFGLPLVGAIVGASGGSTECKNATIKDCIEHKIECSINPQWKAWNERQQNMWPN